MINSSNINIPTKTGNQLDRPCTYILKKKKVVFTRIHDIDHSPSFLTNNLDYRYNHRYDGYEKVYTSMVFLLINKITFDVLSIDLTTVPKDPEEYVNNLNFNRLRYFSYNYFSLNKFDDILFRRMAYHATAYFFAIYREEKENTPNMYFIAEYILEIYRSTFFAGLKFDAFNKPIFKGQFENELKNCLNNIYDMVYPRDTSGDNVDENGSIGRYYDEYSDTYYKNVYRTHYKKVLDLILKNFNTSTRDEKEFHELLSLGQELQEYLFTIAGTAAYNRIWCEMEHLPMYLRRFITMENNKYYTRLGVNICPLNLEKSLLESDCYNSTNDYHLALENYHQFGFTDIVEESRKVTTKIVEQEDIVIKEKMKLSNMVSNFISDGQITNMNTFSLLGTTNIGIVPRNSTLTINKYSPPIFKEGADYYDEMTSEKK